MATEVNHLKTILRFETFPVLSAYAQQLISKRIPLIFVASVKMPAQELYLEGIANYPLKEVFLLRT